MSKEEFKSFAQKHPELAREVLSGKPHGKNFMNYMISMVSHQMFGIVLLKSHQNFLPQQSKIFLIQ